MVAIWVYASKAAVKWGSRAILLKIYCVNSFTEHMFCVALLNSFRLRITIET